MYQSEALRLLDRLAALSPKRDRLLRAIQREALPLNELLKFCCYKDDIFTARAKKVDVYELLLNYILKCDLLRLIRILWLPEFF